MRGFAVMLVFFVHYVALIQPRLSAHLLTATLATQLQTIGHTGVDLFFVLSGYLIYGSLMARPQSFAPYFARRLERIYPTFMAVFAAYSLLSIALPQESKIPAGLLDAAWYLSAIVLLLPGLFPITPMISVAWSLSYEMLFYLVIPCLIALFGLRDRSPNWRIAFFIGMAMAIVESSVLFGGHIRMIMFIVGIVVADLLRNTRLATPSGGVAAMALALGLLSTLLPEQGWLGYRWHIVFFALTCVIFCLHVFREPKAWPGRALSWTYLRWLGNMSYCYYLLHGLTLKAGFFVLNRRLTEQASSDVLFWALLPVMFAATLATSALLFIVIERPMSLTKGTPLRADASASRMAQTPP